MSMDEMEGMMLRDLSEEDFLELARLISQNTTLQLGRSSVIPDLYDALIDDVEEFFLVANTLTAAEALKFAVVISEADNHPLGAFFTEKPFYDRKRLAAGDN